MLKEQLNTILSGEENTKYIDNFNEIIDFLDNIEDKDSLSGIINGIRKSVTDGDKALEDKIGDLSDKIDDIGEIDIDQTYQSALPDSQTVGKDIGGIGASTTAGQLKSRTISQVLDMLIFPVVQPTFTSPSVIFSIKTPYKSIMAVGSASPTNISSFTYTTSKGTVTLLGQSQGDYAGNPDTPVLTVNNNSLTSSDFNNPGSYTYKCVTHFNVGSNKVDNHGNTASVSGIPYPGGNIEKTLTINVSYPWYATTQSNSAVTEQALINWNNTNGSMQTAQTILKGYNTANNTFMRFETPREVTEILMRNPSNGNYEQTSGGLNDWNKTTVTKYFGPNNSISRTYYQYTHKSSMLGDSGIQVKF